MVKLSAYLHEKVHSVGTRLAFGVPGSYVMPIWQEFKDEPRIVLARHETGAVFMADGWSRATGTLGVVLATVGPGLTNCVTGVASAYRDSIPLLVVTGQAPTSSFGRGAFLESYVLDRSAAPAALFGPITKKSLEIVDPRNAAFLIDTAITLATSGRPGPVHLSVPIDLQGADVDVDGSGPIEILPVDAALANLILREMRGADRPLILVGWGAAVAGVADDVAALAEHLQSPVVCTTKAISTVPTTHPLYVGHIGPAQRSDILTFLQSYQPDVTLVLGASLSHYYAQGIAPILQRSRTVRVDVEPDQVRLRHRPDLPIVANLAGLMPAITAATQQQAGSSRAKTAELARFRSRRDRALAMISANHSGHPSMSGTIAALREAAPEGCVVLPDAGNHWLDTIALHNTTRPRSLLVNCGLGAMGWAIGAAVGHALARTGRKTICITGDGSMLMHGAELSVAAEHAVDLLVLVFNNRSHGRVRIGQLTEFDGNILGTDLPNIDFAAWMSAMGLTSYRIESPDEINAILAKACATTGTVGVEVMCEPTEIPACLRGWLDEVSA